MHNVRRESIIWDKMKTAAQETAPQIALRDCSKEATAAATAKLLQSCPTLCDPIDGSPPGSPIPGILQARVLERGAIAFIWDLPEIGIEPVSPALVGRFFTTELPGKPKMRKHF